MPAWLLALDRYFPIRPQGVTLLASQIASVAPGALLAGQMPHETA
ncbi:MAG TPA: hypothetical protein VGQ23_05335 [Burkholderiaceae bacterium]|jgi:hypothetical protein|nr:hypothetical protein [Burkholderiaceae bacterium]